MKKWMAALFLVAVLESRGGEIVDRIVATVDGRAITELELRRTVSSGAMPRNAAESDAEYSSRVLSEMIDDYLRYRDAERFAPNPPAAREVDQAFADLEARLRRDGKDPQAQFRAAGLTEADVRASVEKQLVISNYIRDRFQALVAVSPTELRNEYDGSFSEAFKKEGKPAPAFESVEKDLRESIRARRLNEEIDKWMKELREKARIQILRDEAPLGQRHPIVISSSPD